MLLKRKIIMTKLAVFDFDSTLMDGETIDLLADEIGNKDEVALITKQAMAGELDFFESLLTRVALLEGIKTQRVNEICNNLPLIPGAKDVVDGLKKRGYIVICFSGGFRNATKPVCNLLGIDADFANFLHQKDGALTGKVGGEMMSSNAKAEMMIRIQNLLKVTSSETIAVGDGANDLSMFDHAKTRIAFCANQVLIDASTHSIVNKDLREILPIIDFI